MNTCMVPRCEKRTRRIDGWCRNCIQRWKYRIGPLGPVVQNPTGMDSNGYLRVNSTHPLFTGTWGQYEHTLVMENYLGRKLIKGETVHHRNGNRSDNRLENLELWSHSQPPGQRVQDKVRWAKEILALYGELVS